MATNEEKIKQLYESQLTSQKEQLTTDYESALSDLDQQKQDNQKTTAANLRRTAVEAQKAQMNNEEYYAASGLSSGARAQARLSQENQLQADLTALRTAQQEADAAVERQRGLLAKEYESAIRQAQADNDLALAQALYEEAQNAEAKLLAQQEAAANIMAQAGDYSRYGALYGLTAAEISKLNGTSTGSGSGGSGTTGGGTVNNGGLSSAQIAELQKALNALGYDLTVDGLYGAKSQAAAGGLSAEDAYRKYVGDSAAGAPVISGGIHNGSLETANIVIMQNALGVSQDGLWGPKSQEAAYKKWGTTDPDAAWKKYVASQDNSPQLTFESYAQKKNYMEALNSYLSLTKSGATPSERDAVLRELIAEGLITKAQANDIRDYRG